jgi:hypothetical protein
MNITAFVGSGEASIGRIALSMRVDAAGPPHPWMGGLDRITPAAISFNSRFHSLFQVAVSRVVSTVFCFPVLVVKNRREWN